jgi:hypothetical protein
MKISMMIMYNDDEVIAIMFSDCDVMVIMNRIIHRDDEAMVIMYKDDDRR